jgi:biotin synthase-related radical SAM superfamily protein
MDTDHKESPEYMKMSMGAALTLGFKKGRFYRNARLHCINLLQVYSGGCSASCAYCGLSGKRSIKKGKKSFIRVDWPTLFLEDIIEKMKINKHRFSRICISMITRKPASRDVIFILEKIKAVLDTPISVLISPTIMNSDDLLRFKEKGVDKIGVAIDTATRQLFKKYRGNGVGGPHQWETYWGTYKKSLEIFGYRNVGVHLIVGLGESEKEMAHTIQYAYDLGGGTHLFSFYPEIGSQMEICQPPSIGQYRRIQLVRYLIDQGISEFADFHFNNSEQIIDFGMSLPELSRIIRSGLPFMTSGCTGHDGKVACNRPYANFPPPNIRNYPFDLNDEDIEQIEKQLNLCENIYSTDIHSCSA